MTIHPDLHIYDTLQKQTVPFEPLNPPHVGLYVCGPTVYGDAHLGHARTYVSFDIINRYLQHLGYKVRYVRNITDVGHLENDADEGEDKIGKKARLEQLEPMEVVQNYTNRFRKKMDELNILPPSIEPTATGHIIEQIELIQRIIDAGFAYENDGSVYFDVLKYNENHNYGKLSGRIIEELTNQTRSLDGQDSKRNPLDFALWKKASPAHIMRWNSPWSLGFPGWHVECSAMSSKYLGDYFDIHGGGMDLMFPHHECEIAQSKAGNGKDPAKYWLHVNMLTINGQKMGKSLGNFITLEELFTGSHKILEKAYHPMVARFFILQAHYRSTLDFSNEALIAAEKGLKRMTDALETLGKLKTPSDSAQGNPENINLINNALQAAYKAMNNDFNTAMAIAQLQTLTTEINKLATSPSIDDMIDLCTFKALKEQYQLWFTNILGLQSTEQQSANNELTDHLMQMLITMRKEAKQNKDFALADKLRDELNKLNIVLKDTKDGTTWTYEAN